MLREGPLGRMESTHRALKIKSDNPCMLPPNHLVGKLRA